MKAEPADCTIVVHGYPAWSSFLLLLTLFICTRSVCSNGQSLRVCALYVSPALFYLIILNMEGRLLLGNIYLRSIFLARTLKCDVELGTRHTS